MLLRALLVPGVGLAVQEYLPPSLFQGKPVIALAAGIRAGRLKIVYPEINRPVYEIIGIFLTAEGPQHPFAAEAENRYLFAGLAELSLWDIHRAPDNEILLFFNATEL
jgi:hypothetical protein